MKGKDLKKIAEDEIRRTRETIAKEMIKEKLMDVEHTQNALNYAKARLQEALDMDVDTIIIDHHHEEYLESCRRNEIP